MLPSLAGLHRAVPDAPWEPVEHVTYEAPCPCHGLPAAWTSTRWHRPVWEDGTRVSTGVTCTRP